MLARNIKFHIIVITFIIIVNIIVITHFSYIVGIFSIEVENIGIVEISWSSKRNIRNMRFGKKSWCQVEFWESKEKLAHFRIKLMTTIIRKLEQVNEGNEIKHAIMKEKLKKKWIRRLTIKTELNRKKIQKKKQIKQK